MKIIDAHMHLPVNAGSFEKSKKLLLDEMKINGIEKGIVISDSEKESAIGSMTDCVCLFEDRSDIYIVGGVSPLIDYNAQLEKAEEFIKQKKIIGIKVFCGHEPIYLDSTDLKPVYNVAERYNIPVLFHSGWDNPQYSSPKIIRSAASRNFGVRFVCCHCCYPNLSECFNTLIDCDNVYFDISSVADIKEKQNEVRQTLEKAVHCMPNRFIFGSDYGGCSQREHIEFIKSLDISPNEMSLIFHINAQKIYGIQ